jgi:hypothetical protein
VKRARPLVLPAIVLTALAAFAIGCVEAPPNHLVGGGAGDPQGSGDGGFDSSTTSDPGSGGAPSTSGAGSSSPTGSAATGGQQSQGGFEVALDDTTPASDLMDVSILHVTVTPKNGFSGKVDLAAFDVPSGVTATFDDAAPHLAGAAKTVKLTLHVDNTVMVGDAPFSVTGHGGAATKTASGTLTVNPSITLHIPAGVLDLGGTSANPFKTAYGPYPITINGGGNMVTVNFMNDDNMSHEIHSDSTFGHDPASIPAHSMDAFVRHVATGTYDFYLHDQGSAATPGEIVIQ